MNDTLWLAVFAAWPVCCGGLLLAFARCFKARLARWRWVQLAVGNALVLLLLCSLAFLGGEIYYRFIYDTTDSFDYTKTSQRWAARYVRTNAQGIRDSVSYEAEIPAGKRRVTFLGDSFTEGHGIKHLADRFADRIQRAHPGWEVHAVAAAGADTGPEFDLLKKLAGYGYQFDQVVLVYCLNDLSDIVPEWRAVCERIYADSDHQGWLVRNSYFANTIYYRWKARRDPDIAHYYQFLLPAYRGPPWEQQQRRLKAIRDFVAARGGRLLVVTFPFLHEPLDDTYAFRFVHEELGKFWRDLNVPHLDLLAVYRGESPRNLMVNRFDAHPNEFAHKLAAEAIGKFIETNLPAGPAPTPAQK
jgi:lysophospholipase L1-like esterase